MSNKRHTKFFRALHRPQQVMGGERELMLSSMMMTAILIVSAMNFVSTILGGVIWLVAFYGLRRMAKVDPILSKVYTRQLKYKSYYAAFSKPFRIAKSQKVY